MFDHLPTRRVVICLSISLLGACFAAVRVHAQPAITSESITDEHVRKAIAAIVEELYARKHAERFWDPHPWPSGISQRQQGGYTALAALALSYAGESYQDPRLADAVEHLQHFDMIGTYAITMRAALWARLPDKYLDSLEKDILWLLEGFNPETGCWDYVQKYRRSYWDNSIRQFGALALWEAAKRGGRIPEEAWRRIEEELIATQQANGAWSYREGDASSGSMTAAGLATLFITQDYLHAEKALRINNQVTPNEQAIERGLAWLDRNFSPSENPGTYTYYYYYMYGIERVGLAGGRKYFGGRDWFREGAVEIISRLCRWDPASRTMTVHEVLGGEGRATVRTRYLCFALMFLSRGRVPVAVNKLRDPAMAWNNRPRDAANIANWISRHSEQPVNWQVVDLESGPEDWLDAPILYLASHERMPWFEAEHFSARSYARDMRDFLRRRALGEVPSDAEPPVKLDVPAATKLKRYLDLGGLLVALNETRNRQFANEIEQFGTVMYPEYEWRTLPSDHWAYRAYTPVKRHRPQLKGLSNGVRELIILAPVGDLPETFQARDEEREGHFQTLANIYFYASEMDRPRARLARHAYRRRDQVRTTSSAKVVHAMYDGNWNAEPASLAILADKLAERRMIDLQVVEHSLSRIDEIAPRPDIVFVSGANRHRFTESEQRAIRAYVEGGGVIHFETAGGLGEFTLSAEQMATAMFGGEIQSTLRTPIITGEGLDDAPDLTRLNYRPYSLLETFGARETTPRLRCLMIDGEPRVLFSREDLSNALLDQPVWGVSGYAPESAIDLLGNVVQFAQRRE